MRVFRKRRNGAAAVLAPVKDEPPAAAQEADVLDSHCARQCQFPVVRDGRMAPQGAEQKNRPGKEDNITENAIP